MTALQTATRIAFRFHDSRDLEILERQGQLQNLTLLVFIMHMLMLVVFVNFQEWNVRHQPPVKMQTQISYLAAPPPVEPKFIPVEHPPPIDLTTGEQSKSKSAAPPTVVGLPKQPPVTNHKLQRTSSPAVNDAKPAVQPVHTNDVTPPTNDVTPLTNAIASEPPSTAQDRPGDQPKSPGDEFGKDGKSVPGVGTDGKDKIGPDSGPVTAGTPKTEKKMFRIGPYKREIIRRIKENWHPTRDVSRLVVFIRIARDGQLLEVGVEQSSGSKRMDKQAVEAVTVTKFPPIPEELPDEALPFKFNFSTFAQE